MGHLWEMNEVIIKDQIHVLLCKLLIFIYTFQIGRVPQSGKNPSKRQNP